METYLDYKSFNNDKGIDELLYTIKQYELKLILVEKELRFCKFLVAAKIYKPRVMNLFETLTIFDKKIDLHLNTVESLFVELNRHSNKITNKIECDNLECDVFFIKTQDKLELKAYNFIADVETFILQIFLYLQGTIKNI